MNNYTKGIVKYALLQGVTFMIILTVIRLCVSDNNFTTALIFGVVVGFFVGLANGILLYKFGVPKYKLDAISVDLDSDEQLILATPAKYTSTRDVASGKLFLTTNKLIFINHLTGKNETDFSVALSEIAKIESVKKGSFFDRGLTIYTLSNLKHEFVVDKIKQWKIEFEKKENGFQQRFCASGA